MTVKSQPESDSKRFAALMKDMREGSDDAAWKLLETYGPHIKAVVRRSLGNKLRVLYDSDDFVQSVWASLIRAEHDFAEVSNAKNFVMAIARNKITDELRKRRQSLKYDIGREIPMEEVNDADMHGRASRPSEWAQAKERWDRIMDEETEIGRAVVKLRMAGNTFGEIADILDISDRTARRVIQRVLELQQDDED